MTVSTLFDELNRLEEQAQQAAEAADSMDAVDTVRVEYLGRKGKINGIKRGLKDVSPEERPKVGALANEISDKLTTMLDAKTFQFKQAALAEQLKAETIDVTMPGNVRFAGKAHPLTQMMEELVDIFHGMGFAVLDDNACPEVETEYFNFDALNFPADHPARDMQDTYYTNVGEKVVLRSQTSNAQIRHMAKNKPPIQVVSPGRVYRNEDVSRQKHVLFHQMEGMLVDKGVTVAHLKGVLNEFIKQLFGEERPTRFRTSYFPFTEPSMEMDVLYKRTIDGVEREDWMEILGCGMIDPNVLEEVGIDPNEYSGFAFGMGVERLAMLKYGIHNIRDFYTNDVRFLERYRGF